MRKDTLFANLAIVKNELRKIDSIKIKGYNDFPIKILRHRFGLKPNRQLSNESIKNASQTMEATGRARETKSPEVLYKKDKRNGLQILYKSKTNKLMNDTEIEKKTIKQKQLKKKNKTTIYL